MESQGMTQCRCANGALAFLMKSLTRRVVGAEARRVALPMLLFTFHPLWCKAF